MSEKDAKPGQASKRGGLGRGLGALIPSGGSLAGAGGKGHFWNALDNQSMGATPGPTDTEPIDTEPTVGDPTDGKPTDGNPSDGGPTSGGLAGPDKMAAADRFGDSTAYEASASRASAAFDIRLPVHNETDELHGQRAKSEVIHRSVGPVDSDVSRETVDSTNAFDDIAVLIEVDPNLIDPNPKNPRSVFDEENLIELAESIRDFGLLQPIVIRRTDDEARFELVMGERRLRAAKLADVRSIPAIVRQTDDDAMLRDALLENIHRVQLNPLEEAAAYQQLIEDFGVTHEELATRIKRSRSQISNMLRLMKLPSRVQQRVAAGVLSYGHARAILGLSTPEAQEALATRIVAEGMSVRATEEAVQLAGTEVEPKTRTIRRKPITAPALRTLAENLSDHFDTRALVQLGKSKGKIVVEFASIDDLERIIAVMVPHLATARADRDQQ